MDIDATIKKAAHKQTQLFLHGLEPLCTCPQECDCQDPENGLFSNHCPEHNLYPERDKECPIHGE